MLHLFIITSFALLLNTNPSLADNSDWEPGFQACDQDVRRPIAQAWRASNYVEEELGEIEKSLKDGDECGEETLALLESLDALIGTVYDPLGLAITRLAECEKYLSEGLMGLLKDRSDDLEDRLFKASRKVAKLYAMCER